MAGRTYRELRALREQASCLLERGLAVEEVAEAVGASARTVRRWRQQGKGGGHCAREPKASVRREADALAKMLRTEYPAVLRVMLDMAKRGDVRAAALVVKLLDNTLTSAEEGDDGDSEAALNDIERELSALPSAIASEIVGLLAQAESEPAGEAEGKGAAPGGRERPSLRLPWQEDGDPPDERADSL